MPWTAADAKKHTKKADTRKRAKLWAKTANDNLDKGDAAAIRIANSVISKEQFHAS